MSDLAPHLRVLASAGSGKTFLLVERYIALLRGGAKPPCILATTFTRAAAAEIQQRVLTRLLAQLDEHTLAHPSDTAGRAELLALLGRTARNLHHLRIRTLDSFFASVVRAFAFELGVSPSVQIADEGETMRIRQEAVRRALGQDDPQMVETLRNMLMGKTTAGISRSVSSVLMQLDERVGDAGEEAWERIAITPVLSGAELEDAVAHLESIAIEGFGDQRFNKAAVDDAARARAGDWAGFVTRGFGKVVALEEGMYYNKPVPEIVPSVYEPLVIHARGMLRTIRALQNHATRELLGRFRTALQEIKRERGVLFFADFPRLMESAFASERCGEDIGYRLDGTIEHVLLDEFQDTSSAQWQALVPLLHELVGDETRDRSTFVVGDLKQSIYGWRGGEAEILSLLPHLLIPGYEDHPVDAHPVMRTERLNRSWRSSPIILKAVDCAFHALDANPAVRGFRASAEEFKSWYRCHEAQHTALPGYAELRIVPNSAGGRQAGDRQRRLRARMELAAQLILDLHQDAPNRTIGVLLRTGRAASAVLHALRGLAPHADVAGDVSVPVTDSPAATVLLDLLRMIDHPFDRVAAFNVGASPLGPWLGIGPVEPPGTLAEVSQRLRMRCAREGLARFLADAAGAVLPTCGVRDRQRVEHLLQLAEEAQQRPAVTPGEFVLQAESTRIGDAVDVPIRVMTMHRAKGLEFDAVVLPELDARLKGRGQEPVAIEREAGIGRVTGVTRWIEEGQLPFMPESVREMHAAHHARTVRESLCLLYVALTRARSRLHLLIDDPSGAKETSGRWDHLLCHALAPDVIGGVADAGTLREAGGVAWAIGSGEAWAKKGSGVQGMPEAASASQGADTSPAVPALRIGRPAGSRPSARAAVSASALAHADHVLKDRLHLGDPTAAWFGTVVHRLFEEIEWADDPLPGDERMQMAAQHALQRLARVLRGVDGAALTRDAIEAVRACLAVPAVRTALARPETSHASNTSCEVIHEWPFVRRREGGRLQQGFIDRLVIERDAAGRPVRATITDYKTDRIPPDDPAALRAAVEGHSPQMQAYRSVVAERYALKPEDVGVQLLFVRLARVEMV